MSKTLDEILNIPELIIGTYIGQPIFKPVVSRLRDEINQLRREDVEYVVGKPSAIKANTYLVKAILAEDKGWLENFVTAEDSTEALQKTQEKYNNLCIIDWEVKRVNAEGRIIYK